MLGAVPVADIAVALVNRAVTRGVGASSLPVSRCATACREHLRTLVAMPALLTTRARRSKQHLQRLEVHYLAAPDGELHFALLTDWLDAATEHMPDDDALLDIAMRRHRASESPPRPRGGRRTLPPAASPPRLERQRAALDGLGAQARQAPGTQPPAARRHRHHFRHQHRKVALRCPTACATCITLDADTRVPRDAPRRLIGKMAHPLNRPRFDPRVGRVVEGYGILQPRVTSRCRWPRRLDLPAVFSGAAGVDPYAAAVSDVYQDLFGEGSYAGKGIYDVDAFEAALAGRVPENSLLSHDLFEGIFARAGLASDVEVVEEFPARYDVASMRQHRWVRGDWQLLPWIFGRADAGARHGRGDGRTPLSARWKMLDNLRRSLSAPMYVAALVAGWLLPLEAALPWMRRHARGARPAALLPAFAGILPRRSQRHLAQPSARAARRLRAGAGADRVAGQHARLPGLAACATPSCRTLCACS